MNIEQIDKNFAVAPLRDDMKWIDARDEVFSLHGVFYDETENRYRRMPQEVADTVNEGVAGLCKCPTGGRLRFMTNSPYIAVKAIFDYSDPMRNMAICSSHGFGIYTQKVFRGICAPTYNAFKNAKDGLMAYTNLCNLPTQCLEEVEIYLPLYSHLKQLFIGVKDDCSLQRAKPYTIEKPVVYYGSSITQGGCASHPGNDYPAILSREFDCDYINLGFSGNGKAEPTMNAYLAGLDASVFVLDYDHNAPTPEYLEKTHYPLYETVRKANPDTPIIMISRPDFYPEMSELVECRAVIKATYERAKKQGDKKIWYIDGEDLFGKNDRDCCTVDGVHPNDLGFYRMAKVISPVLKKALKKAIK